MRKLGKEGGRGEKVVFNVSFTLRFPINENRKIVSFQILVIFFKTVFSVLKTNIFQHSIFDKENKISLKTIGGGWG